MSVQTEGCSSSEGSRFDLASQPYNLAQEPTAAPLPSTVALSGVVAASAAQRLGRYAEKGS